VSYAIGIAILGCLLVCYFSACNIGLKTLSRKRLADRLGVGFDRDRLARFYRHQPMMLLMTGTIRAVLSLVVLLAMLYYFEERLIGWTRLAIYLAAFLVAGGLVSIFAVAIPVSWARYQREGLIALSLPLLNTLLVVFSPIVWCLHLFDPVIRRISGVDLADDDDSDLSDEVLSMVEGHEDGAEVDEAQKEMIEAVFDLSDTDAEQVMTPRTDIIGIEVGSSLEQVKQAILQHGHSRIPVYEQTIDNIVGILYAKDMIRYVGDSEDFDLRSVLRDAMMVPESKNAGELLGEFKAEKVHIALVLDEYGGTAGLVSIEDILEELVGEIQDEYEQAEQTPQIQRVGDQILRVDARVEIDDLIDELNIELPEDEDYDTVGGFVFATLGHIPKAGEAFDYEGLRFTVTEAERTRVVRVEVLLAQPQKASAESPSASDT
jgi:magnesium and cobalt exporter, CNNM family